MAKAIIVDNVGSPNVMQWKPVAIPEPKSEEILIRHTAIGLNYIDIYHRSGVYPVPKIPFTPGLEGAGIVEAVGSDVKFLKVGDRVAYGKGPIGAYAQYRTISQEMVVKLPDEISDQHAVGAMMQGMTVHMLVHRCCLLRDGMTVLVHAAAGSVGSLLCQWARLLGATVIGTVSTEEKITWAKQNGCDYVINYAQDNFVTKIRDITSGQGCNVVYDSVGKDTFMDSLDCLMPMGMIISYGQSSGAAPAVEPAILMEKGSIFLTRPSVMHYKADFMEYTGTANEIFTLIANGAIKVNIGQSYYLSDVARAHKELEGRMTKGSSILIPDDE